LQSVRQCLAGKLKASLGHDVYVHPFNCVAFPGTPKGVTICQHRTFAPCEKENT
jgi:hypothetical protein